jgi:hypothetical protein
MVEKSTIQVKVRMTRQLHRSLMRDAQRSGQTLNAEILRRLEESLDREALTGAKDQIMQERLWRIEEMVREVRHEAVPQLLKEIRMVMGGTLRNVSTASNAMAEERPATFSAPAEKTTITTITAMPVNVVPPKKGDKSND